jgi:hypothetical protein
VNTLTAALIERASKEAAPPSEAPKVALPSAKRIRLEDAIANYLGTVAATRAHKTWLAYNLILNTFRESCSNSIWMRSTRMT